MPGTFNYCYKEGILYHEDSGKPVGSKHHSGYLRFRRNNKYYLVHRIIWELHYGAIPEGMWIDHKNRIRDDNRIENLRLADRYQNAQNADKSKLKYDLPRGVHKISGGDNFRAQISFQGKLIHIGTYKTPEEAHDRIS